MRVILGIGNPGREYDDTRHNLGFAVIDTLVQRHRVVLARDRRCQAEIGTWESPAGRVLLVKPSTYVNRSGETALALLSFYKLPPTDLLVLVDDLNLPTGHLRLRGEGSAGGHNGLKDIEARFGQVYPRLRLGCGPLPAGADQVAFVLGGFRPEERADATAMLIKAADAATAWIRDGVAIACTFNGPLVAVVRAKPPVKERGGEKAPLPARPVTALPRGDGTVLDP